jgi:DNA (cytosine-5)-methyltransferase 1
VAEVTRAVTDPTPGVLGNLRTIEDPDADPVTAEDLEPGNLDAAPDDAEPVPPPGRHQGDFTPYLARLADAWTEHLRPKGPEAPTVVSTFAGAGGSSLGYSMAGFRELLAVEFHPHAAAVFRRNFPHCDVHEGDIARLSVNDVLRRTGLAPGELDVFDGSPPCQGFSTAGERILDDPRNGLFRDYCRLLRGLQPKAFIMENVSGMVKGKMRLVFVEILRELKACGYQVRAALLNAQHFGVPQSRARMIFVGARQDLGVPPTFPVPEQGVVTVRQAIGHLPPGEPGPHSAQVINAWYRSAPGQSLRKAVRFVGSHQSVRLDPDRPSYTQVRAHLHWRYDVPRQLTIEEAALLMSFPTSFVWLGTKSQAKERIGNAVAPLFMHALALEVRKSILRK